MIPAMTVPATADYFKRDHYIRKQKKEYDEFSKANKVVRQILTEKKQYVTLEQVMAFAFHLLKVCEPYTARKVKVQVERRINLTVMKAWEFLEGVVLYNFQ